jgi:predicted P-loop ATPase
MIAAVFPDLANTLIALRGDLAMALSFGFDQMTQTSMVMSLPPIAAKAEPGAPPPRPLDPEDITRAQEWLQEMGLPRLGRENVVHAVELIARARPFHPVRAWLDGLEWDGAPRIGSWLHDYLGTPDDEYHRQIGAMFLIAMVARIYEPGVQADYMLVLEGPQGEEKSKFCRALAGDRYFSDHLPKIDGDQVRLSAHLRGKWLVEIAELSAISRADAAQLKSFITRRVEIYIPKYGRIERREPRQTLFVGSCNDDDYVNDHSGGRRFWPVKVVMIALDRFVAARSQLFAEAVAAYRDGKPWWPDRDFEKKTIAPIQEERQFSDAWSEKVHEIICLRTEVTIAGLGRDIGLDAARLDMNAQKRLGTILKRAGWRKAQLHDGTRFWRKA